MFGPFHGLIRKNIEQKDVKEEITPEIVIESKPTSISSNPLPTQSKKPLYKIVTAPKLPSFKAEDYKKLFTPTDPIKLIEPEIIPREKPSNKSLRDQAFPRPEQQQQPFPRIDQPFPRPQQEQQQPFQRQDQQRPQQQQQQRQQQPFQRPDQQRFRPFELEKEQEKVGFFDKDIEKHSLQKYKIGLQNKQPSIKNKKIKSEKKDSEKSFYIVRPEIISKEKSKKHKPKSISKPKKIASVKISKKSMNLMKKSNKILDNIENGKGDYESKFNKLKKAYVKQHDSLLDVFNGYQKLYKKTGITVT
jgi:hypothetical protein